MRLCEVAPWAAVRLVCALGHRYAGRVRSVQVETTDMDGEPLLKSPEPRYDPPRCVVCGLITWKVDAA